MRFISVLSGGILTYVSFEPRLATCALKTIPSGTFRSYITGSLLLAAKTTSCLNI